MAGAVWFAAELQLDGGDSHSKTAARGRSDGGGDSLVATVARLWAMRAACTNRPRSRRARLLSFPFHRLSLGELFHQLRFLRRFEAKQVSGQISINLGNRESIGHR